MKVFEPEQVVRYSVAPQIRNRSHWLAVPWKDSAHISGGTVLQALALISWLEQLRSKSPLMALQPTCDAESVLLTQSISSRVATWHAGELETSG